MEDRLRRYSSFLRKGVFDLVTYENVAFVCRPPRRVKYDDRRRLHSVSGGAVEWTDGVDNHFIHGVSFPDSDVWQRIVTRKVSAKEAISLPNVEQRTIACTILGYDRVVAELGGRTVAKLDKVAAGSTTGKVLHYELVEVDLEDDGKSAARFVSVECPSTGKRTFLRVHPKISSCESAVAWTFRMESREYVLELET